MPDENTAGRHDRPKSLIDLLFGGVGAVSTQADYALAPPGTPGYELTFYPSGDYTTPGYEPEPFITGDEAAALITQLHKKAEKIGYERPRLDRGRDPQSGAYYELGFVHGEVSVRFSHLENRAFRAANAGDAVSRQFVDWLYENEAASR